MNLRKHYDNLYKEAIQKIGSDNYQTDDLIDSEYDARFGITLLIRPDIFVCDRIQSFLTELKNIEPYQYYYPSSDIHVTLMSIISCHEGFDLSHVSIMDYVEVVKKSIIGCKNIDVEFKGITASPSCIMIQGFLNGDTLNNIRNNLRINFKNSSLQQTIDERYTIQTAHLTVVRFKKLFSRKTDFLKLIEKYRNYDFGVSTIDTLDLVYNDWYQRNANQKELYRFSLNSIDIG